MDNPRDDALAGEPSETVALRTISVLAQIDRDRWNAIANPGNEEYDPFLDWDFLSALEESGCVSEETGWIPQHLIAEDAAGQLVGALPLYIKTHSQGEYVFDFAWADALERAGRPYYPKLLSAIPFTPVTGRRVLAETPSMQTALIAGAKELCDRWSLSSWHMNFPAAHTLAVVSGQQILHRIDRQFVWHNNGYADYDAFLDALSSRKRKALRKERKTAQRDISIEHVSADELRPEHWDVFFACYQHTGSRKWGTPYLNRAFFDLIHQRMADRILLILAKQDGRYIAAALNFIGSHALYGRYWGRLEDTPYLHFELCYHQAIEAAIARGLDRVEAGAQGEHKLARGYRPEKVHSMHWIADPGFRQAIADYLERERVVLDADIEILEAESPYKSLDTG